MIAPTKTLKRGKHGDSHRHRPSTENISPRRPNNSESYLTYRHRKGSALPSYEKETEKDTNTDTMIKSPPKGRKRSLLPTKVLHRQSKSRVRKKSLSLSRRYENQQERKTKLPDTVRQRQENAADSDSTNSSSSSETDIEKDRPANVHHFTHILKPPKFDEIPSFESFLGLVL